MLPAGRQNVASVIPDPDTVGDWLGRMGDPQTWHAGLVGLGQVWDALTARFLRHDGHQTYTLDTDATLVGGKVRCPVELHKGMRVHADAWFFVGGARVSGRRMSRGQCIAGSPKAYNPRHRGLWNIYICSWASGGS